MTATLSNAAFLAGEARSYAQQAPMVRLRLVDTDAEFRALQSQAEAAYDHCASLPFLQSLGASAIMQRILRSACYIETARVDYRRHAETILEDGFNAIFASPAANEKSKPAAASTVILACHLAHALLTESHARYALENKEGDSFHRESQLLRGLGSSILLMVCHASIGAPKMGVCDNWAMQFLYSDLDRADSQGYHSRGHSLRAIGAEQSRMHARFLIQWTNPKKHAVCFADFSGLSDYEINILGEAVARSLPHDRLPELLVYCKNSFGFAGTEQGNTILFALHHHAKDRLIEQASHQLADSRSWNNSSGARAFASVVSQIEMAYCLAR